MRIHKSKEITAQNWDLRKNKKTSAQKTENQGENVTFSVHFTSSPPPEEGDWYPLKKFTSDTFNQKV